MKLTLELDVYPKTASELLIFLEAEQQKLPVSNPLRGVLGDLAWEIERHGIDTSKWGWVDKL